VAENPIISVGLPVYNGETHVESAVRSVMEQTLDNLELVVSDNASTDATEEVCRRLAHEDRRIRYYRNAENLGAAANFNRVFQLSRGPYFKWLGHDDVLDPKAMAKALDVMQTRDDVSIVHWLERMTDEGGNTLREYTPDQGFDLDGETPGARFRQMLLWRFHGFAGDPFFGLIRRSALESTRLQGRGANPNYLLMQELSITGKFVTIPDVLAVRVYNDVRVTAPQMIKWLDPSARVGFPHFAKAKEYFRVGLTFGDMAWPDRVLTALTLLGYHVHPREVKGFLWDISHMRPLKRA
jgi:glycosyltransferase involved in cell wall biosynthesis